MTKKELFEELKSCNYAVIKSKFTQEDHDKVFNEVKRQLISQGAKEEDIYLSGKNLIKIKNDSFTFYIDPVFEFIGKPIVRSKDIIINKMFIDIKNITPIRPGYAETERSTIEYK